MQNTAFAVRMLGFYQSSLMNKAAQALGRLAAGKPKRYSAAELEIRTARLAAARSKRWPKTEKAEQTKDQSL